MNISHEDRRRAMIALVGRWLPAATASAEDIAVGNYGSSANGMPFAVALAKGYFKEEGATSPASSRRKAAERRYEHDGRRRVRRGESGAIAVAIQQRADIKIVSDNVLTIAEFAWMVKKDSPIKSIKEPRPEPDVAGQDRPGRPMTSTSRPGTATRATASGSTDRIPSPACLHRCSRSRRPRTRRRRSRGVGWRPGASHPHAHRFDPLRLPAEQCEAAQGPLRAIIATWSRPSTSAPTPPARSRS